MRYNVKRNCDDPSCLMNGTPHGHWTEEDPVQSPAETETSNATEDEVAQQAEMKEEIIQRVRGDMRKHEQRLIEAMPKGPAATMIALEMIIRDLEWFQEQAAMQVRANLVAEMFGGEPPDCGDPDCPNHAEARAKAEVPLEKDRPTDAGADVSEQPAPSDSDPSFDEE